MNYAERAVSQGLLSRRILGLPGSATVSAADLAAQRRRRGEPVIDLSAGRAAEPTPAIIRTAAQEALKRGDTHKTEARGRPLFLQACADKLHRDSGLRVDPERHVVATLGCKHGLLLALMATVDPGDEVLVEDPGFVSYAPTIRLVGGIPVGVPLRPENQHRWDPAELARAVGPRTRVILLCNPHNPTGVAHTQEDLEVVANLALANDLVVIADEIYEAATWGGRRHRPIAGLSGMAERTIGLMGLTKTYSMGGWRIGYAYASEGHTSALVQVQQHFNSCAGSFAQAGAAAALSPASTLAMQSLWRDWEARCHFVTESLNSLPGLSVAMPEAGFYAWTDISETGLSSTDFVRRLLDEHHVAAIAGAAFGETSDGWVRFTCVRSWDELRAGVEGISAFVEALAST